MIHILRKYKILNFFHDARFILKHCWYLLYMKHRGIIHIEGSHPHFGLLGSLSVVFRNLQWQDRIYSQVTVTTKIGRLLYRVKSYGTFKIINICNSLTTIFIIMILTIFLGISSFLISWQLFGSHDTTVPSLAPETNLEQSSIKQKEKRKRKEDKIKAKAC